MSLRKPPNNFRSLMEHGLDGIEVEFWGPKVSSIEAAHIISSFYLSTWGDLKSPSEAVDWSEAWFIAQDAMAGKVLPNTLESLKLTFGISGVSRACTHQLVRSRVGAVFGQQGGRDNNWSGFNQRMPASFLHNLSEQTMVDIETKREELDVLYRELLRSGIPYQDARYVLPIGMTTNLVASYNMLALKGTLARRLCNRMMWETNHVAREIHDLAVEAYPWVGRSLRSNCERGTCGSVSPMFPPSDFHWNGEKVVPSKDNATLQGMMARRLYDWPINVNGAWTHYGEHDHKRIKNEANDPDSVWSMTKPLRKIATKTEGMWGW